MGRALNHQHSEPSDWGDRAVRWLKVYYGGRSMKMVANDLDETESLIALWWHGGRLFWHGGRGGQPVKIGVTPEDHKQWLGL